MHRRIFHRWPASDFKPLLISRFCLINPLLGGAFVRREKLVRAEGLEPSRTLRSNGFSYPATAFAAAHRFRNGVWGLDYPFTVPGFGSGCQVLPV